MHRSSAVLALLLFLLQLPTGGGKVASEYDRKANFAAFRTYGWLPGHHAYDPGTHKLLVATIDRELSALGLQSHDPASADVTVSYYTLRMKDVNLKEVEKLAREGKTGPAPTYDLGKLVIVVRDAHTRRQLWAANTREYLSPDRDSREKTITQAVTNLFATYPTRKK
jgi:hypothetical protein